MTLALLPYAQFCGPDRLLLRVQSDSAWPADFFALTHWLLEEQTDSGTWQVLPGALRALSPLFPSGAGGDLQASVCVTGGLVRIHAVHPEVDVRSCCAYANIHVGDSAPYYLELEGLNLDGSPHIPACFYDAEASFSTLSQKLTDDDPIASAGRLEATLVDLEGRLSRAFMRRNARNPAAFLTSPLGETEQSVVLDSTAKLSPSGFVWIGREAIRYEHKDSTVLSKLTRASLGTSSQAHQSGAPVYMENPYFKGRWLTLKRASSERYSPTDGVVYRGLCDTLSPDESNLTRYRLAATDATGLLDGRVGERLPEGVLLNAVCIWSSREGLLRKGNDTLYVRQRQADSPETITALRLSPGIYLSDYASQDHPRHIVGAIRDAFERALPGLLLSASMDANGRLCLVFWVADEMELLPAEALGEGAKDSALETIGFSERASGSSYASQNGRTRVTLNAERAPRTGLAPNCEVAVLDPLLSSSALIGNLASYRLFRIDDEFMFARRIESGATTVASTLACALSTDETRIELAAKQGFPAGGGFVMIEEEIIAYGKTGPDNTLLLCVRGAFNTAAAAHALNTPISIYSWPMLLGLSRGHYASEADWHGGTTRVKTIGGSDYAVVAEDGEAHLVRQDPATFLLDLLDAQRPQSLCGLESAPDWLNEASVRAAFEDLNVDWKESFLRLVSADETYREVLSDIAGSFDLRLLCDEQGRLTIRPRSPALAHETQSAPWRLDTLCLLPKLAWHEGENDPAIDLDLDYDPIDDSYKTRLHEPHPDKNFESFPFANRETRQISSRSLLAQGSDGNPGAGQLLARDRLRAQLARQLSFAVSISVSVPLREALGLALGDTRRFISEKLPIGAATETATALAFEVQEIERDLSRGLATLCLNEQALANYAGFSPALTIESASAETRSVVVRAGSFFAPGTKPSDYFVSNDALCLLRMIGALFWRSPPNRLLRLDETDWEQHGRATLCFEEDFSFTPVATDTLICASYEIAAPPNSKQHAFCYLADAHDQLGSANDTAFVYGY